MLYYFGTKFAKKLKAGYSFAKAFNSAADWLDNWLCTPFQDPQLDDDGNGISNSYPIPNGGDGYLASEFDVGFNYLSKSITLTAPRITSFTKVRIGDTIYFNVRVYSDNPIAKAVIYIFPNPPDIDTVDCPLYPSCPLVINGIDSTMLSQVDDSLVFIGSYFNPDTMDSSFYIPYIEDTLGDFADFYVNEVTISGTISNWISGCDADSCLVTVFDATTCDTIDTMTTGADGVFSFDVSSGGDYFLNFYKWSSTFLPHDTTFVGLDHDVTGIDITYVKIGKLDCNPTPPGMGDIMQFWIFRAGSLPTSPAYIAGDADGSGIIGMTDLMDIWFSRSYPNSIDMGYKSNCSGE